MSPRMHVILSALVCVAYNALYELAWRLNPSLSTFYIELPFRIAIGLCIWTLVYRTCLAVSGVVLILVASGKYLVYGLPRER